MPLTPDPKIETAARQRLRMQRLMLAGATSAIAIVITFAVAGFGQLPYAAAVRFALIAAVLFATFYLLMRSGWNLRLPDPDLAMEQALAAGLAISYLVFEGAATRPAFLAFYLMAFMFSIFFLEGPRLVRIALAYLAFYAMVIGLLARLRPETLDLRREIPRFLLFALMLAWFGGIGWHIGRMRRRLRRASDKVEELHREQRLLFDTANVGIALIRDRMIIDCNHFLADMLGYLREELIGRSTRIYFRDDASWEALRDSAYYRGEQGHAFREELVLQRKDGTRITCDIAADSLIPRHPEKGIVAVYNDVSATRKAELELHNALLEQVAIFENAVVGIAFTRERRVLHCNGHMKKIFGYGGDEMLGLSSGAWFPSQECWERRGAEMTAAFARGEIHVFEQEFVRKDGTRFWCSVSGAAVDPRDPVQGEGVFVFADITEKKRQEEEIHSLAHHDALTGLPNRRLLDDRLAQSLAHARRANDQVAVMLFDLDGFKSVNDTRGHAVGDAVLTEVARRLQECFRESDTVGRLGGDEFVANLEGHFARADLHILARKAVDALSVPIPVAGEAVRIGASIGIALFPGDASHAPALLALADQAMYAAKAAGGNCARGHSAAAA